MTNSKNAPVSARAYKYCTLRASGASPTAAARGAGYKKATAAARWLESQPLVNQIITKLVTSQGRSFLLDAEARARLLGAIATDATASASDRIRALQLIQRIEETNALALNSSGLTISWDDGKAT